MPSTAKGYPYPSLTDPADVPADIQALATAVNNTAVSSGDAAGGDLSGTYPNPQIAANAVGTSEIADGSVTNAKLTNSSLTINGSVISLGGSATVSAAPSGSAGGDLTGTYPNPTIANAAVTEAKIADNAVTTSRIANAAVTNAKLANSSITINGTAVSLGGSATIQAGVAADDDSLVFGQQVWSN